MRFYLICSVLVVLFTVPYAAAQFVFDIPFWLRLALLPFSEGLHYMAVVIHEPGHALTHWIFGRPAIPLLDRAGGGLTYVTPRQPVLLGIDYAIMAAAGVCLAYIRKYNYLAALGLFCVAHIALVLTGWDVVLALYMGHGAETIAACFFLYRALVTLKSETAERYVTLIFALHLYLRTALLCIALLLSPARQAAYALQKGVGGEGDLYKIAALLKTDIEPVALSLLLFLLAGILTAAVLIKRRTALQKT